MSQVTKQTITLEKSDGSTSTFDIWTDLGDMTEAAVTNWAARRKPHQLTAKNLCEYISSKGVHKAYVKKP